VAGPTSDDRPATRAIEGPQDSIARELLADDRVPVDADRPPSTPPAQMSTIDAATVFHGCRERLQGLLGDDADITVVEHAIAGYPLDDEENAALWLWAIAPFDPATLSHHMPLDGA
jgi:hypothetical protein